MAKWYQIICMCGTFLYYPISDKECLEWNCSCGNYGSITTKALPIVEKDFEEADT